MHSIDRAFGGQTRWSAMRFGCINIALHLFV
jgi:hypothetical protein